MNNNWLHTNRKGIIGSIALVIYITFLMLPTATFFFETYHMLKIEALYVGYQVFKIGGYVMAEWQYGTATAVIIGVVAFGIYLLVKKLRSKKLNAQEVA